MSVNLWGETCHKQANQKTNFFMRQEVTWCDDWWHHGGFAFDLQPHQKRRRTFYFPSSQACFFCPSTRFVALSRWLSSFFLFTPQLNRGVTSSSLFDSAQTPRTGRQSDRVCARVTLVGESHPVSHERRAGELHRQDSRHGAQNTRLDWNKHCYFKNMCALQRVQACLVGERCRKLSPGDKKKLFLRGRHFFFFS